MTYKQVLACKKVDFQINWDIRRFNELEYFKNLSTVNFSGCIKLEELSLPYITISNKECFQNCSGLKKLTTKYGLKITNGSKMFNGCSSLQSLDTSRWDLSNLSNGSFMFDGCTSLTTLDTSKWNLSNLSKGSYMFSDCTALQSLDTSKWNLSNLVTSYFMFYNCTSLTKLDTSKWNLHKVESAGGMIANCTNLVNIDLSDNLENCRSYYEYLNRRYRFIYDNCKNLESLVGNHTETDNVRLFIGYSKSLNISGLPKINLATVNAIIRGVASSPDKKLILALPEPVKSQVTDEYRKILESKNWVIN